LIKLKFFAAVVAGLLSGLGLFGTSLLAGKTKSSSIGLSLQQVAGSRVGAGFKTDRRESAGWF
jgi:hypothetical protein